MLERGDDDNASAVHAVLKVDDAYVHGVRIYRAGCTIDPHVDAWATHPLAALVHWGSSSSRGDKRSQTVGGAVGGWPLELVGHGRGVETVRLRAGQMLLYEAGSVLHARPTPLRGEHFANSFVQLRPVGWRALLAE